MTDGEEFEGMGFDPKSFFEQLRRSASVKAGAIIFGQAQVAYYDILKESMSEEDAFNLTAHTTECIIKGAAEVAPPLIDVFLRASAYWETLNKVGLTDKEVPGSGN